jgi:hypothetical protein
MSRFILFRGSSLYGSVDRMLDHLAAAFAASGDRTILADVTRPDYVDSLQQALAEGIDGFVGFTGIGLDRRVENNLYNALGRPFASIYLDPLLLYWDQVTTPIRRRVVFTTAPDDVVYAGETLRLPVPVRHLPHAADPLPQESLTPWERRDVDILFSGTAPDDPAGLRAGWAGHGARVEQRLNDILDAHDANPLAPLLPLIATHAHPVARLGEPDSLHPYFAALDAYLRARARWRTALALMPAPVLFVGPGWDRIAAAAPGKSRARIAGAQPAGDLAEIQRRTKLVVNTCTPYHGSHERVFQAMAGGAVSFGTETAWLRQAAPVDGIVLFRPGMDDPAERASALLAPGSSAEAMAAAGHTWLASAHTWHHRAESIKAGLAAA